MENYCMQAAGKQRHAIHVHHQLDFLSPAMAMSSP